MDIPGIYNVCTCAVYTLHVVRWLRGKMAEVNEMLDGEPEDIESDDKEAGDCSDDRSKQPTLLDRLKQVPRSEFARPRKLKRNQPAIRGSYTRPRPCTIRRALVQRTE